MNKGESCGGKNLSGPQRKTQTTISDGKMTKIKMAKRLWAHTPEKRCRCQGPPKDKKNPEDLIDRQGKGKREPATISRKGKARKHCTAKK